MKIEHTPSLLAILDDDMSVQSALQDLIESEGMSALCFDSAEQFLDSGAKHRVACLIADIRMPGMSGIELQVRLNAERYRIPIIFITGRGDIPLAVRAMKEGASDFFTKPVDGTSLLNSVEQALRQYLVNRREATEHVSLFARYESLTPREREVLPMLPFAENFLQLPRRKTLDMVNLIGMNQEGQQSKGPDRKQGTGSSRSRNSKRK